MARQTLIWTALPYAMEGTRLRLSVYLSPRLYGDRPLTTLSEFPDFLEWPQVALNFQVQFAKGPVVGAQRISPPPDLALWQKLFPGAMAVESYTARDESDTTVLSYPAVHVLGFVHEQYKRLALSYPTRLPPAGVILDRDHLGILRVENGQLSQHLQSVRAEIRAEQAKVASVMRAAYQQKIAAEQERRQQPIVQPQTSTDGGSGLPTGLRDHIEATIRQNQQQASRSIGQGLLDRFGATREEAVAPDTRPAYRPGEVPGDQPLVWPIDQTPNPLRDFLRAELFHRGTSSEISGGPTSRAALPMPMIPKIDFHKALGILSRYPALMRRLGLVVDLEVDTQSLGGGAIPPDSLVRVLPTFAAKLPTAHARTWTAYRLAGGRFLPAQRPSSPEVSAGMLNLSNPAGFALVQTDPDSAAGNLLSLVNGGLDVNQPEAEGGLPALRSCGISLVRSGADIILVQSFVMNSLNNRRLLENRDDIVLYAEDIAKGYRPDIYVVRGAGGNWHSLTARTTNFQLADGSFQAEVADEGWVSQGATRALNVQAADLLLHQMMFSWQGWSLSVPPLEEGDVPAGPNELLTDLKLKAAFRVKPGSLPLLRYGKSYHVRARMVDLAGNGLPFTDADPPSAIPQASQSPFVYRRSEPLTTPLVVQRVQPGQGTTATRIVVRTRADGTSDAQSPSHERHIAPPSVAVKQAEIHGMFDTETGVDRYLYEKAITERQGTFPLVVAEPQPALPYLPDPFARHVALRYLPGAPREVYTVPFTDAGARWPDWRPFRLRLVPTGGAARVSWTPETRVLEVEMPRGSQVKVPMSCAFSSTDPALAADGTGLQNLQTMFIWSLFDSAAKAKHQTDALQGKLWMLTPSRDLELVHAVQKPLAPPRVVEATASRELGEVTARVSARVTVHGPSTDTVQVSVQWQQIRDDSRLDDPVAPGPVMVPSEGYGMHEMVEDQNATELNLYGRHSFGDTKHKRVIYTCLGSSRFKEFFPELEDTEANFCAPDSYDGLEYELAIPASAAPPPPRVAYAVPIFSFQPYVTGETRTLAQGEVMNLRQGLVKEFSETVTSPDGAVRYERDQDYQINYATGAITWLKQAATAVTVAYATILRQGTDRRTSIRRTGVRIFLERPWFESGEGELLGVVLPERLAPRDRVPRALRTWVTHWGRDPIWRSEETHRHPRAEHFPLAVAVQKQVRLPEAGATTQTVTVAGHKVEFDWEKQLWYCDVAIDSGPAYFPFVRLSLVRFQPTAVPGAHFSPVVLADYVQMAPDRATTVTRLSAEQIQVTVAGGTYQAGRAEPALVEAYVEQVSGETGGTLLWARVSDEPVMLERRRGYWTGVVPVPAAASGQRLRLALAEYEQLQADAADRLTEGTSYTKRVVFADVVELTGGGW